MVWGCSCFCKLFQCFLSCCFSCSDLVNLASQATTVLYKLSFFFPCILAVSTFLNLKFYHFYYFQLCIGHFESCHTHPHPHTPTHKEKSRKCHNHKPLPFPDTNRKRKPTNPNKHKSNKRTKSTKINSLFPKRGNRNAKRTENHKNKMTQGKTENKSPRRITKQITTKQQRVRLTPGPPP